MAKRRQGSRDEVMLIPFLDILSSLIGILILIIVVLSVSGLRQTNGRPESEVMLARKFRELKVLLSSRITDNQQAKDRLASLQGLQAELAAKRQHLAELRKRLDMSGDEARANKDQAARLQKLVEDITRQIQALAQRIPQLQTEIEELKKQLLARQKKPDDKPPPIVVRPSGSGSGANRPLFFIETSNGAITIRKNKSEKIRIAQENLTGDKSYNDFLQMVKGTPGASLTFLTRPDGWASYFLAAGWAESNYGLITGKLPIPGNGEIDLGLFERR